jgi:hypothetical protein
MTIDQETHDRFRRLQILLARECGGDQVAVFDLACKALEERVLKAKRAFTTKPRTPRRFKTTNPIRQDSRDVPAAVARAVWARDGERCAFIGPGGVRCPETRYLELHHTDPWALFHESTPEVLSVRCRPHNRREAELVFGEKAIRERAQRARNVSLSSAAPPARPGPRGV